MAAPIHQMAGGQFMPQQPNRMGMGGGQSLDMAQYIYSALQNHTVGIPPGWQSQVPIGERVRIVHDLTTNMRLANAGSNPLPQQIVNFCLKFEIECFTKSPDKATYDQRIRSKNQELHLKRQAQGPQIQEAMNAQAMNAQARQQMMMNMQQQNFMRAQMAGRGGGGPGQPGLQHLQNPMTISQMPQQSPMGLNPNNGMGPQTPGQPGSGFPMPGGPQRGTPLGHLSDHDKARVSQEAMRLMQITPPEQKKAIQDRLIAEAGGPAGLHAMGGKNPMSVYFFKQAYKNLFPHLQPQQQQQQQQQMPGQRPGMPPNGQGTPMQPGQQRPMNPNMMNNMGNSGGQLPFGSNMESIINDQKQGILAERSGQVVVPASSGPGQHPGGQPMGGAQGQNMFPQGPGQGQRPQMSNGFDLQQQQALLKQQLATRQAAQMHAGQMGSQLHGQPGGLNGPMPVSQTPPMNALNAPVGQPPVAMGQMPGGQPGSGPMGPGMDPRLNQGGQPTPLHDPVMRMMLNSMTPQERTKLLNQDSKQLMETFQKFKATQMQRMAMQGRQPPQGGMPMNNPMNQGEQNGIPMQQVGAGVPANMQAMMLHQQNQQRLKQLGPQAQFAMDTMDVPPQVLNALANLPPDVKKWGQLKEWWRTQPHIAEALKQRAGAIQLQQFISARNAMAARGPGGAPMQPGLARPGIPQNPSQVEVTPQDMQNMRANNPKSREVPDEQLRLYIQNVKFKAIQARLANLPPGAQQPQMPQSMVPPGSQPGAPSIPAGAPPGFPPGQPASAPVSAPEPAQNASAAAPPNKGNRPTPQNKPAPPNPSPATVAKNLKRPMSDDQETPAQPPAGVQRPPSQATHFPMDGGAAANGMPMLSEAQLASLTPEQRQNYERRKQMLGISNMNKNIMQEESNNYDDSKYQQHMIQEHMKEAFKNSLLQTALAFNKFNQPNFVLRWLAFARDENKLRAFHRMRLRLNHQFDDGERLQAMKERLTMGMQELMGCKQFIAGLGNEFKTLTQKPMEQQQPQGGQVPPQQPPKPMTAPVQVPAPQPNDNSAVSQPQVHNKLPQRPNSRGIQPPAAPTSSQPPFSFSAKSPDGKPLYATPAQITQENLQLPTKKKIKTGPHTSSPASTSQNASPQTKITSPDLKKQESKATPKPPPAFQCTFAGCEMGQPTFPTETQRKKHHEEFHVIPFQDPLKFLEQASAEFQQAEQQKVDAISKQRANAAVEVAASQGAKPEDSKTPKPTDNSAPAQTGADTQLFPMPEGFGLSSGTVNPATLFAPVFQLDPMYYGGVIETSAYETDSSLEDTPESSKESCATETGSDIPDQATLNIDLNFTELLNGQLLGLNFDGTGTGIGGGDDDTQNNAWDITDDMFTIPEDTKQGFQMLDTSFYEWNPAGSV